MKDFKNKNGYGNMKTEDEAYDGILLKTGDEGYRYYSEDDYSEDNSIADIIIACSYVSETSSTARVNMSATCENADDLYIRLLNDKGTVLHSRGTSGISFSTQKTFVSAGTYIVEAEVVRTNGGRKVRRASLRVETSVGEQNRCDMCDETGWMSATAQCASCGAWQTHAAPIQLSHYVVSESISTATINMTASCTNAVDMYLRVIREDGTECYSRHASSTNISKTLSLGVGRYTLQAEAISLTGGIRIATNDMIINPNNSGSSGSSSNNCSNCGGTGYVGSANCSVCNPEIKSYDCSYCLDTGWLNGQKCTHCSTDDSGPNGINITPSYSIDSTLYTLNVTATCDNAWWMRAEVENTTFSNEASTNNVGLEAIGLEEGTYSVKVTAQRNGIYRYQYANVTLKNREISYACPPYIDFSNETGEYNSTTGKYSVSVSVYCEDATHIDMKILNSNKALCASIDGSGTSASGICDLAAGRHYAKFVIERGSLGTLEDVYAFDVNAITTGAGGGGGGTIEEETYETITFDKKRNDNNDNNDNHDYIGKIEKVEPGKTYKGELSLEAGKIAVISAKITGTTTQEEANKYFNTGTILLKNNDDDTYATLSGGWYPYSLMSYFKIAKAGRYTFSITASKVISTEVNVDFFVRIIDSVDGFAKCSAFAGVDDIEDFLGDKTNNNFVISATPERLGYYREQAGECGKYLMKSIINGHANVYWEHFIYNNGETPFENCPNNMKFGVLLHNAEEYPIYVNLHRRSFHSKTDLTYAMPAMTQVWIDYFNSIVIDDDADIDGTQEHVINPGQSKWISLNDIPYWYRDAEGCDQSGTNSGNVINHLIFNGVINCSIKKDCVNGGNNRELYRGDNVYCYTYWMKAGNEEVVKNNAHSHTERAWYWYEACGCGTDCGCDSEIMDEDCTCENCACAYRYNNHDSGSGSGAILWKRYASEINVKGKEFSFVLTGYDAPNLNEGEKMTLYHAGMPCVLYEETKQEGYTVPCARNYGVIYVFEFAGGVVTANENVTIKFKYDSKTNPTAAEGNGGAVYVVATSNHTGFGLQESEVYSEFIPECTIKSGEKFNLYIVVSGMSSMPLEVTIE